MKYVAFHIGHSDFRMLIVPSAYGNSQQYQCPTRSNFGPSRRQLIEHWLTIVYSHNSDQYLMYIP